MIKKFSLYFLKILKFLNLIIFKITKRDFLIYLKQLLRDDSYQKVKILDQNIIFFVPNVIIKWRVDTFFSKEPETLEWINNFENYLGKDKQIIFWDIGGNIGLYSIYAALKYKNIDITTFEPSTSNLQTLSRNISTNNLNEKIRVCQIPLTNKSNSFLMFKESQFQEGGAFNVFGENFDYEGNKFVQENSYKIYGTSINFFLDNKILEIPDYIKIDVDGIEHLILLGADNYLKNSKIKSFLIEINDRFTQQRDQILDIMKRNNFKILHKKHSEELLNKSKLSNIFNYVFVR